MITINAHLLKLQSNYLFADIARKVAAYRENHPDRRVISLGIGDVTRPLAPAVIAALHEAVDEMGRAETFHGYGPEQGYGFLRDAIASNDYASRGVHVDADEIFISDGAKSDVGSVCYPNNPTGTVLSRGALRDWVDYARREGCVILYDSAYEAFITEEDVPHSIYEIDGAREVAVEFRSYSKTAGFTGLRCAYAVVPKELRVSDGKGGTVDLHHFWNRRQCTKYNGCPYIVQRAAAAVYSDAGKKEIRATIASYLDNARLISDAVRGMGVDVFGGVNAPYIWVSVPGGMTSWDFFDRLLNEAALVCTPGAGFGRSGEGYVRLTAFGSPEDTLEAIERLRGVR